MATGICCIRTGWAGSYDISTDLLLVLCIGNGVQGHVTKMAGNTVGIKPGFSLSHGVFTVFLGCGFRNRFLLLISSLL